MINIYFSRDWDTLLRNNLYIFCDIGLIADSDNITREEFSKIWDYAFKSLKTVCEVSVMYKDMWELENRRETVGKVCPLECEHGSRFLKFYIDLREIYNLENSRCLKITKWEF